MNVTERFVRDLVWVVNSPSLMTFTGQESVPKQPLKMSDVDREHLTIHLTSPRERRVGRYFERLIVYWLRFILRCEIVDHALQLRDGKRTAGEIDVLFRDGLGRLNHWELACKFYLQVNDSDASIADYIGPNGNDTLRKKAERLLNHQLPLRVRYFPEIDISEAFVKGRIFYHWQTSTNTKVALPEELAAGHLEGRWLRTREVAELLRTRRHRYRILRKPFWLSDEFADPTDGDILSPEEVAQFLKDHFTSWRSPILFSEFCDSASIERESERWFVVPDQWPFQSERN